MNVLLPHHYRYVLDLSVGRFEHHVSRFGLGPFGHFPLRDMVHL